MKVVGEGRPTPSRLQHIGSLDGFRALAIIIVILSHAGLGKVVPGGFGVTIFFFLSGFLITSLLRTELTLQGRIDFLEFYRRRAYRILPPFLITLLVCFVLTTLDLFSPQPSTSGMIADFLFITNYAPQLGLGSGFPIPLWSLDVEEHFYIIFPFLLFLSWRRMMPIPPATLIVSLCLLSLAARIYNVYWLGVFEENYYWSHTRIDSILFGALLAVWNNPAIGRSSWIPNRTHFALALALLAVCLMVRLPEFRETIRYSLQGCALYVVFSFALRDRGLLSILLSHAILRLVAYWSYTLYLIHVPLFEIFAERFPEAPIAIRSSAAIGLSIIFAIGMRAWVEKPLQEWRRRSSGPADRANQFQTPTEKIAGAE